MSRTPLIRHLTCTRIHCTRVLICTTQRSVRVTRRLLHNTTRSLYRSSAQLPRLHGHGRRHCSERGRRLRVGRRSPRRAVRQQVIYVGETNASIREPHAVRQRTSSGHDDGALPFLHRRRTEISQQNSLTCNKRA